MRIFLLLLTCFLFSLSFGQNSSSDSIRIRTSGETHLIVIGVSNYKYLDAKHQLKYAHKDAELIKNYYQSIGVTDIEMFLDSAAINHSEINRKIRSKIIKAQSGDEVILYFSGHGSYDEILKTGFLLLHNVEASSPALMDQAYGEILKINELIEVAKAGAEKNVAVKLIFDACKSGNIPPFTATNLTCISACASNEKAKETSQFQQGIFTHFLHKGLQEFQVDVNKDDKISFMELELYVSEKVSSATNNQQHPQFISGNRYTTMGKPKLLEVKNEDGDNDEIRERGFDDSKNSYDCEDIQYDFLRQIKAGKFTEAELDSTEKLPFTTKTVYGASNFGTSNQKEEKLFITNDNYFISSRGNKVSYVSSHYPTKTEELNAHQTKVSALACAPIQHILTTASIDGTIIVWELATKTRLYQKKKAGEVTSLCHLSDTKIAYFTTKGQLFIWDLPSNKTKRIKPFNGKVNSCKLVENYLLALDEKEGFWKIDPNTFHIEKVFIKGVKLITLEYSENNNLLIGLCNDDKLVVYDFPSLHLVKITPTKLEKSFFLTINHKENYLFISSKTKNKTIAYKVDDFLLNGEAHQSIEKGGAIRFNEKEQTLGFLTKEGNLEVMNFSFNPIWPLSAENLYSQLQKCGLSDDDKIEYQDIFITALTQKTEATLNALVGGNPQKMPSSNTVNESIRYAQLAVKTSDESYYNHKKNLINLGLLQVYDIILKNDSASYFWADQKLKELLKLDPNTSYLYNAAALLHQKFNHLDQAKKMIAVAEKSAGMWIEPTYNYGVILQEDGDLKGAELKFEKVTKVAPNLTKGVNAYLDVLAKQNKLKEADKFEKKIKKEHPEVKVELPEKVVKYRNETRNNSQNTIEKVKYKVDTLAIGDKIEGGIVACIDFEKRQLLIAAPHDLDSMYWSDALKFCENMTDFGYSDWKLPNYQELRAMANVKNKLLMTNTAYWSSNTSVYPNEAIWINFSNNADIASIYFERYYGVRPVRIVTFMPDEK